jgi:hypothetical protein
MVDWLLPGIHLNVNTMAAALSVLTSMITPALLISATGTYILSTSNRLARVVDRMRALQEKIETDVRAENQLPLHVERIHLWETQLGRQIERLRLLQSALTLLYTAAAMFICTSVIIGVLWASGLTFYWFPVVMGLGGAGLLFVASILLVLETRKAVRNAEDEVSLVIKTKLARIAAASN